MARTESTMAALGTPASDFALADVAHGHTVSLDEVREGRPLLVIFLSRHCPYVQHVAAELARIDADYRDRVAIVGISSNDIVAYPDDTPANMAAMARQFGFRFPILFDDRQEAAKSYQAACTPDFFLFDSDDRLAYRGQLDGSRPRNDVPVTGRDVRAALDAVIQHQPADPNQKPSLGCNIKWKAGNEPEYFAAPPAAD